MNDIAETCNVWLTAEVNRYDRTIESIWLPRRHALDNARVKLAEHSARDMSRYVTACGFIAMGWTAENDERFGPEGDAA